MYFNVEVLHKWHSSLDPKKIVFLFCLAEELLGLYLIWGLPKKFEASSKLSFDDDLVMNALVIRDFLASLSISLFFKAVFSFVCKELMMVSYSEERMFFRKTKGMQCNDFHSK